MDVMGSANNLKPPFFKPIFGLIFIDEAPACNPDINVTSPVAERLQLSYSLRIFVEELSYKAFIKVEAPRNSDDFQSYAKDRSVHRFSFKGTERELQSVCLPGEATRLT